MKNLLIITILLITTNLYSQNIFIEKYDDCHIAKFCLDCGNPKAKFENDIDSYFKKEFTNFSKTLKGNVYVQILVDSIGKQCVKSIQRDVNISTENLKIREKINSMPIWLPSIDKNNNAINATVFLNFDFKEGKVTTRYQDFFNNSFMKKIKSEKTEIRITNPVKDSKNDLTDINFTIYNSENSKIRHNYSRAVTIDNEGTLWLGTDNGLIKMQDDKMELFNAKNSAFKGEINKKNVTPSIRYASVDLSNNKWFVAGWNVYKYDDKNWTKYDSINSPINWARKIVVDNSNNVWFTSWDGVCKYDGENWSVLNTSNSKLPSNKVLGMFVDRKNRQWIGTFEGNVMIENGVTRLFNDSDTPLKNGIIDEGFEDKNGNLWFSLYSKDDKHSGLAKLTPNNEWSIINIDNSNIPSNSISDFVIDEKKNIIWLGIWKVGLAMYDGKKWSLYTIENSKIPSVYLSDLQLDKIGNLWIGTYSGLVKVNLK
jgi:ligand-binding sensor domain-containing protein